MQQSKKYLLLILLIAVLVSPGVVFASWWNPFTWNWNILDWFSKPQTAIVQPQQNNPTAGWKTYTNSKYGFTYQMPDSWMLKDFTTGCDGPPPGPDCGKPINPDDSVQLLPKQALADYEQKNGNDSISLDSMSVYDSPDAMANYQALIKENTGQIVDMGGNEVYYINDSNSSYTDRDYTISHGNAVITVTFREKDFYYSPGGKTIIGSDSYSQYVPDLEKIISTITFKTPAGQATDWKTYTNNAYNYQINYIPTAAIEEEAGSGLKINYQNGDIEICSTSSGACGNFGGVGPEAEHISRQITIDGNNYNIPGFILNGNEELGLNLPNNMFAYLNISGSQNSDTESKLLQILSTFKFTE